MKHELDNNDKGRAIFLNNGIFNLQLLVTLKVDLIFSELMQMSFYFPHLKRRKWYVTNRQTIFIVNCNNTQKKNF